MAEPRALRSCAQRSGIPAPRRFGPDPSRSCFLLLRPDEVLLRLFFLFHMQPSVSPFPFREEGTFTTVTFASAEMQYGAAH